MDMRIRFGEDVGKWADGIAAGIIPLRLFKLVSCVSDSIMPLRDGPL